MGLAAETVYIILDIQVSELVLHPSDVWDGTSCGIVQVSDKGPEVRDHVRGDVGRDQPCYVCCCLYEKCD